MLKHKKVFFWCVSFCPFVCLLLFMPSLEFIFILQGDTVCTRTHASRRERGGGESSFVTFDHNHNFSLNSSLVSMFTLLTSCCKCHSRNFLSHFIVSTFLPVWRIKVNFVFCKCFIKVTYYHSLEQGSQMFSRRHLMNSNKTPFLCCSVSNWTY